jgi:ribokinase
MSVIVAGSINMDLVLNVAHFPAPGETLTAAELHYFPGGKGANQAVAIARMGTTVAMVGRVGSDGNGPVLLEGLQRNGVDITHVDALSEVSSGLAFITVESGGQNSIVIYPGANARLTPSDVESAFATLAPGASLLVTQLEVPTETVLRAMSLARDGGLKTVFNPAPARPLNEVKAVLSVTNYLILNETEAMILSGIEAVSLDQAASAARELLKHGIEAVVITLGSAGSLLVNGELELQIPAPVVDVVDTTAAGDAFVAGFCVALLEGRSMEEAVRFGNGAGAVAVTRLGAQPSLPTYQEVLETISDENA